MSDWNLGRLRKIAGLNEDTKPAGKQLNETWEADEDGEDADAKIASEDKGQKAFEQKNKKSLAVADKKADATDKAVAARDAKVVAPKAAEEKKEEPKAEEAKRRGKAPNANSKAQRALAKLKTMTRGQFIKYAADELEMGKNYASAFYARHNPKSSRELKEANTVWGIAHPFLKGFVLAENRELNQMQWIDSTSAFDPVLYVTEAEAAKVVKYMAEWKSQAASVEQFDLTEFDDAE